MPDNKELFYKLHELLSPDNYKAYWEKTNMYQDDPFLGLTLFPDKFTNELSVEQIKGKRDVAVVIQPSAYDAKPTMRDKIGVQGFSMQIPFFREALHLTELDKVRLTKALVTSKLDRDGLRNMLLEIYDQLTPIVKGADARREEMAMSLLADGTIEVYSDPSKGNQISQQYNYDFDGEWRTNNIITLIGDEVWTAENKAKSTPIRTILNILDRIVEQRGYRPKKAILTTKTLNDILMSEEITKLMTPNYVTVNPATNRAGRKEFLESYTGVSFFTYDKVYKTEQHGDVKKYYPDGQITLIPEGKLGSTLVGRTPDEFNDMYYGGIKTSRLSNGVTLASYVEGVPYNWVTTVSMVALPSFEAMEDVYIIRNTK